MKLAVIGGGFSGLLASYLLEKEGIDVTLYEKEEYLGGHCKTIQGKDIYTELGTVCSFSGQIKELLIDLKVDYTERFVYRNFVSENFDSVEHMLKEDVMILMDEVCKLKDILGKYSPYLEDTNFGYIPEDLMVPINTFLKEHDLRCISQIIAPYLSSFGFGSIYNIQAYYVFKVFNINTLYSFIGGKKSLFINNGTSELINKLSRSISNIKSSLEVTNIETVENKVKVETNYDCDYFDKVLITSKLPSNVIKDLEFNELMKKIETNHFIACAYEVYNKDLVTTYYKSHLGKQNKIQFFYAKNKNNRTILVAYAYGVISKTLVDSITEDIKKSGVNIKQLTTVKQWHIFPHVKAHNLTQNFYKHINEVQKLSNICLVGSLISKPSIDNLYVSVKNSVNGIIEGYRNP